MKEIGLYVFGDPIDDDIVREKRPLMLLENGAKYEGEWIKGTDERDGRGI